jgi:hypothetical protein
VGLGIGMGVGIGIGIGVGKGVAVPHLGDKTGASGGLVVGNR